MIGWKGVLLDTGAVSGAILVRLHRCRQKLYSIAFVECSVGVLAAISH